MKKYLPFCVALLLSLNVQAQESPKQFKNPMFNQTILADSVRYIKYIEMKLTPTFWGDVRLRTHDNDCSLVTEDEKAALLRCHPVSSINKDLIIYYLFTSKYKFEDMCRVWECTYWEFWDNAPKALPYYSKVQDCEGEESYDTPYNYPFVSCYEEITSRGWEKYLPASYREKLEKLKPEKE